MFTEALIAFPWVVIPSTVTALAGLIKAIYDLVALLRKNHKKRKLKIPDSR